MAVKLRFRRMGRTKLPIFALVAADSRSPRDGRFIEDLGRYEPIKEPAEVVFNEDRILYWLQQGAQPSHTVRNLLSKQGLMLRLHMLRKGKTEEEIEQAVNEFRANREEKGEGIKLTAAARRQQALEVERKQAAEDAKKREEERKEREAELARQKEEADKLAHEEAEAIRAKKEAEAKAELAAAQDAEANKGDEINQEDNVPAGTEVSAAAANTGEPADGLGPAQAPDVTDISADADDAATEEPATEAAAEVEAEAADVPDAAPDAAEEQEAVKVSDASTKEIADATAANVAAQAEAGAEEGNPEEEEKA